MPHIIVDSTVTEVLSSSFFGCSITQSIDFSEATSLATIDAAAFRNMGNTNLTHIDLRSAGALKAIGSNAFNGITNLKWLALPDNLVQAGYNNGGNGIGYTAFANTNLKTPDQIVWNSVDCFLAVVDHSHFPFEFTSGPERCPFVYSENTQCALNTSASPPHSDCCTYSSETHAIFGLSYNDLVIDGDVEVIAEKAFMNCHYTASVISSVYFTQAVKLKTIGKEAFYMVHKSALIELDLSGAQQLETIAGDAFKNNPKLETITLTPSLRSVEAGAFLGTSADVSDETFVWNGAVYRHVANDPVPFNSSFASFTRGYANGGFVGPRKNTHTGHASH